MKSVAFLACICLVSFAAACSGSRTIPDFANPRKTDDFTQLASGEAGEKEPATFWIFGGSVPFATWRQGAASALTTNGWTIGPDASAPNARTELLAEAPDGHSCLSFSDLNGEGRDSDYVRRWATLVAPDAVEASKNFAAAMYVLKLRCP
ncbi:MAG: hypothetical protein HY874_02405 [Chloroflexi bacterium]|nr:hypothetical protein [Chloroflexota bacterium]